MNISLIKKLQVNNEPLSLAKAKRDGIKMAKLPLDRYLEWAPGSRKTLNINHMISILLDLKISGDWQYALRNVPRRKLLETHLMAAQSRLDKNTITDIIKFNIRRNEHRKGSEKSRYKKHSLFDDGRDI